MRFVSHPPMERQIGLDRWRCPFFGLQLLQAIAVKGSQNGCEVLALIAAQLRKMRCHEGKRTGVQLPKPLQRVPVRTSLYCPTQSRTEFRGVSKLLRRFARDRLQDQFLSARLPSFAGSDAHA